MAEVIEDGRTGLLVPPGDVDALADSMRCLMRSTRMRQRMGVAARRYVEREADSSVCIRRFERFYRSLAQERP